MKRIKVLLF